MLDTKKNQQLELSFGRLQLSRFRREDPPPSEPRWLIENFWLQGATGMLNSMPKVGKTWIALDMAVSIASGLPFLDTFPVAQGPVMIYSPEGPREELQKRLINLCTRRGLDFYDLPLINIETPVSLEDEIDQVDIRSALLEVRPRFVFFDPLTHCFGGDENGANDVKAVARWLTALAHESDAAIMICHHSTKANKRQELLGSIRGSTAFSGFGDHYLFLEPAANGSSRILLSIQKHFKEAPQLVLTLDDNSGFVIDEEGFTEEAPPIDKALQVLALLDSDGQKKTITVIRTTLGGDSHKYTGVISQLAADKYVTKYKVGGVKITKKGREFLKQSGVVWDSSIGAVHTTRPESGQQEAP